MLGANDAKKVIEQLQTERFMCTKDCIMTSDFVIIRKSKKLSEKKLLEAIRYAK